LIRQKTFIKRSPIKLYRTSLEKYKSLVLSTFNESNNNTIARHTKHNSHYASQFDKIIGSKSSTHYLNSTKAIIPDKENSLKA
jgi:hypothetical protein